MTDITRLEICIYDWGEGYVDAVMEEDKDGDYVYFDDYKKLQDKYDKVMEKLGKMKEYVDVAAAIVNVSIQDPLSELTAMDQEMGRYDEGNNPLIKSNEGE